jgi:hypothetical protein
MRYFPSTKRGSILSRALLALLALGLPTGAIAKTFAPGAYIIDMGQETQTIENGLKPYGLVYRLIVTQGIPVEWAILSGKAKDAADFKAGNKTYRAGSFIVAGERVTPQVETLIAAWRNKGVVVDGPLAAGFDAPIHKQLTSWPRAVLDAQTAQQLVVPFYANAEVPTSSYVTAGNPTLLTQCGDVYVLPHADPQNWTEASGYFAALNNFIAQGGNLWSACHAVSALESIPGGQFLSQGGLVLWTDHDDGTPPYAYNPATLSDPVMQFLGTVDGSMQNGSEQIFLPAATGWRTTTTIATTDPDHAQAGPGLPSPGPATVLAYGRAMGDANRGFVMYEAGHNLDAGPLASRVAAQRAYFNFILLSGLQKAIAITEAKFPETVNPNKTYPVSVKASGGVGQIRFHWTNDCGGTFADSAAASTQFIAPAEGGKCAIKVEVADECGRANFTSEVSSIVNGPRTLDVTVTFPNGSKSDPGKDRPVWPDPEFETHSVAIDRNGVPLPGTGPGKCAGCFVGEKGHFIGPIIHLTVTGVVAYQFRIFNTVGEYVGKLNGQVTAADLTRLASKSSSTAEGPRVEYEQRIIWTGRDDKGQKAANGAYILMAELDYPADLEKGVRAKKETYYKVFGHVR